MYVASASGSCSRVSDTSSEREKEEGRGEGKLAVDVAYLLQI